MLAETTRRPSCRVVVKIMRANEGLNNTTGFRRNIQYSFYENQLSGSRFVTFGQAEQFQQALLMDVTV
jgi:hypothetical protein